MYFTQWFRVLIDERADAACLISAEVLRHHAARGEEYRILRIDVLCGRAVFVPVESGLAVRVVKRPSFKEPRCAGMIEGRTRPEHSHVLLDLRVGHAAIVDGRAFRRRGEFTKDVVRDDVREIL